MRQGARVLGAEAVIQLRVAVLFIVVLYTDGGPREVLDVVFEGDEEDPVVAVREAHLLFKSRCPESGIIRPVSLPFALTPWVPELEQLDLFALAILDLVDGDKRVGVARDDTLLSPVFALAVTSRHHDKVPLVCRLEHIKEILLVLDQVMMVRL